MEETKEATLSQQTAESKTVQTQTVAAPEPETQEQINWKKFRDQREKDRKEKEAADRRAADKEAEANALKAAMEAILNKQPQQQQHNQNNDDEETEEQRIDRRVAAALAVREKQNEESRRQREQQEFPQKLASTYADFNQVCTTDNLDYLEYHYPEVASAFKHAPDGFEKWQNVYKAVKRFVPNTDTKKDQAKADKNFNKPQSISSPSSSQANDSSAPYRLTEQRRAENWQRMQKQLKGLN